MLQKIVFIVRVQSHWENYLGGNERILKKNLKKYFDLMLSAQNKLQIHVISFCKCHCTSEDFTDGRVNVLA